VPRALGYHSVDPLRRLNKRPLHVIITAVGVTEPFWQLVKQTTSCQFVSVLLFSLAALLPLWNTPAQGQGAKPVAKYSKNTCSLLGIKRPSHLMS